MEKNDLVLDLEDVKEEEEYPFLSWCRSDRLRDARVLVAGCGALGNEVVKNLALFGVGHLFVMDFDRVELSNLTRSVLFRREDAEKKRPKVEVVAERAREINPSVQVVPLFGDVTHDLGLGLLKSMDAVISCLDNRWARYVLNRMCMRVGKTWVDGGIDGLEGTARVFSPGKNCYACSLGPEAMKDLHGRMSCASVIRRNEEMHRVATTPVVASVIGAVQVQEAIKILHPEAMEKGECTSLCGKMYYYEGQHLTSRLVDFQAWDEDCPEHERWTGVIPSDFNRQMRVSSLLTALEKLLDCRQVAVSLRERTFVDYLVSRKDDARYDVMKPVFRVADYVASDPELGRCPDSAFYLHEIRFLDRDFPDQDLPLEALEIPLWDILQVNTEKGIFYIEMDDENIGR